MNGYERIRCALEGRKPDRVPVMLHNFMMAAREAGISMERFRNDPHAVAESFIRSVEKYQFDGILVDIDTVTLAGALGVPVDFPLDEPARTASGCLSSLEEAERLQIPRLESYRHVNVWLEAVRMLKDHFGNEIFIRGNCDQAPFTLAGMMRGAQNWMVDLMVGEEDQLIRLLDYCSVATEGFIRLMAQTGCHMVSNGDSPAGPSMISPEMYEKFAMPWEKRAADVAHSCRLPYALHICGNTDLILDRMLLTGADAFELDYKTDARKVFEKYHDRAVLIGNIDPSGVLALGSEKEVVAATAELLEIYSGSDRFILNAGCAIPPGTPSGNIAAMIKTAREFRS